MASGIYKIINKENGKFYIGSAINIKIRFGRHVKDFQNQTYRNVHLQRVYNKYGGNIFEFAILEECPQDELLEREQYYIDILNPDYNICRVAGSTLGIKLSDKARRNMSIAQKGIQRCLGYKHTLEARKNMSEARKLQYQLRPVGKETREKLSKINKGKIITMEQREKISKSKMGLHPSLETRKRMSKAHMGRPPTKGNTGKKMSEEAKAKISKANPGNVSNLGKKFSKEWRDRISESLRNYHRNSKKNL